MNTRLMTLVVPLLVFIVGCDHKSNNRNKEAVEESGELIRPSYPSSWPADEPAWLKCSENGKHMNASGDCIELPEEYNSFSGILRFAEASYLEIRGTRATRTIINYNSGTYEIQRGYFALNDDFSRVDIFAVFDGCGSVTHYMRTTELLKFERIQLLPDLRSLQRVSCGIKIDSQSESDE